MHLATLIVKPVGPRRNLILAVKSATVLGKYHRTFGRATVVGDLETSIDNPVNHKQNLMLAVNSAMVPAKNSTKSQIYKRGQNPQKNGPLVLFYDF